MLKSKDYLDEDAQEKRRSIAHCNSYYLPEEEQQNESTNRPQDKGISLDS